MDVEGDTQMLLGDFVFSNSDPTQTYYESYWHDVLLDNNDEFPVHVLLIEITIVIGKSYSV